jgi:hypothetical protein
MKVIIMEISSLKVGICARKVLIYFIHLFAVSTDLIDILSSPLSLCFQVITGIYTHQFQ